MRDDDRQSVRLFRAQVNEVDLEPINRGDKLWQGVQPRLYLSPVVIVRPAVRELLHGRELDTLRLICDRLPFGPACCGNTPAKVDEVRIWKVHAKGTDGCVCSRDRRRSGTLAKAGGYSVFRKPGLQQAESTRSRRSCDKGAPAEPGTDA